MYHHTWQDLFISYVYDCFVCMYVWTHSCSVQVGQKRCQILWHCHIGIENRTVPKTAVYFLVCLFLWSKGLKVCAITTWPITTLSYWDEKESLEAYRLAGKTTKRPSLKQRGQGLILKVVFWAPHPRTGMYICTHRHTDTYTQRFLKIKNKTKTKTKDKTKIVIWNGCPGLKR